MTTRSKAIGIQCRELHPDNPHDRPAFPHLPVDRPRVNRIITCTSAMHITDSASGTASPPPSADDQVHLAIEDMKQEQHLVDRLAAIGGIQQPIELCRRGAQPADDLAP